MLTLQRFVFSFALAAADWAEAAACVRQTPDAWEADAFKAAVSPWFSERGPIIVDARGRQGNLTVMQLREPWLWEVQQVFYDEEEDDSEDAAWSIRGLVDLRQDRNPQGALVEVISIGE